jgi:hypothetical protein
MSAYEAEFRGKFLRNTEGLASPIVAVADTSGCR